MGGESGKPKTLLPICMSALKLRKGGSVHKIVTERAHLMTGRVSDPTQTPNIHYEQQKNRRSERLISLGRKPRCSAGIAKGNPGAVCLPGGAGPGQSCAGLPPAPREGACTHLYSLEYHPLGLRVTRCVGCLPTQQIRAQNTRITHAARQEHRGSFIHTPLPALQASSKELSRFQNPSSQAHWPFQLLFLFLN